MKSDVKSRILAVLDQNHIMTIATIRPDGWPQATTVTYANRGLILYCFVARLGQKHFNILRDSRISVAIAKEVSDPLAIKGISLAAHATEVGDREEYDLVYDQLIAGFPAYGRMPKPNPALT